ncbi:MAG: hypothetical protein DHS20C02_14520 [Micavibrio sp.]|nr:MAG: hypothetical protein DHS20C02_14520 [Micavibrio sp.]
MQLSPIWTKSIIGGFLVLTFGQGCIHKPVAIPDLDQETCNQLVQRGTYNQITGTYTKDESAPQRTGGVDPDCVEKKANEAEMARKKEVLAADLKVYLTYMEQGFEAFMVYLDSLPPQKKADDVSTILSSLQSHDPVLKQAAEHALKKAKITQDELILQEAKARTLVEIAPLIDRFLNGKTEKEKAVAAILITRNYLSDHPGDEKSNTTKQELAANNITIQALTKTVQKHLKGKPIKEKCKFVSNNGTDALTCSRS